MEAIKQDQFINRARRVHGDRYDYSRSVYRTTKEKVAIICPDHGEFSQTPERHLKGSICLRCSYEQRSQKRIKSNSWFISESKNVHGDTYDYSKSNYTGRFKPVIIICKKHKEFSQHPGSHLSGRGCVKCGNEVRGINKRKTKHDFIKQAKEMHGDKFDYSNVKYIEAHTKVKIICKVHGIFHQTPNKHLNSKGCPICAGRVFDIKHFIAKAIKTHGDIYDYSLAEYRTSNIKVDIICTKHGVFNQTPSDHISGYGCPICRYSKGELAIKKILNKNKIDYEAQYRLNNCKNKSQLPFDFALISTSELKGLIEFNGRQHYEPVVVFGGESGFLKTKENDKIKKDYCLDNNIPLLTIAHWESNIEKAIMEFVKSC